MWRYRGKNIANETEFLAPQIFITTILKACHPERSEGPHGCRNHQCRWHALRPRLRPSSIYANLSTIATKNPSHGCTPGNVRRYGPLTSEPLVSESVSSQSNSPAVFNLANSWRTSSNLNSGCDSKACSTTSEFSSRSKEQVE